MVLPQNKINGTRQITNSNRENRPKKNSASLNGIAMKFSGNWAVCIFRWSISNQKDVNWWNKRRGESAASEQSAQIYSDHGSYSHIPRWLLIVTYNSEYVTITMKLCVEICHTSKPHLKENHSSNASTTDSRYQWCERNIFTNNFTRKSLSFRFIEFLLAIRFCVDFSILCFDAVLKVEDLLVYNWNQRGNIVVPHFETLMNISTGWPNV